MRKHLGLISISVVSLISLVSCGENAVAKKGYELFKKDMEAYVLIKSGGQASIVWNSCTYIYFDDDNYPILKKSCWYYISSELIVGSKTTSCRDYITYTDGDSTYSKIAETDYQNAVYVFANGTINGEKGNL